MPPVDNKIRLQCPLFFSKYSDIYHHDLFDCPSRFMLQNTENMQFGTFHGFTILYLVKRLQVCKHNSELKFDNMQEILYK